MSVQLNQYNGLSPREQLNLYRVQLKEATNAQEIADLKEKIEDDPGGSCATR